MDQIIPLDNAPNQTFTVALNLNGSPVSFACLLRYNEIAKYWILSIYDTNGALILDSLPFVTGNNPACNILAQFQYLNIGAIYVINISGLTSPNYPNNVNLGTGFVLVWGDFPS